MEDIEFIRVRVKIKIKLIVNRIKKMKAKVKCISERGDLLTKLPLLITLKSMPPQGYFSKTNST